MLFWVLGASGGHAATVEAVEVPLVHVASDPVRWYVEAVLPDGSVRQLAVDTGTTLTALDDDLAEELGLEVFGRRKIRGTSGWVPCGKARLPEVSIGEHRVRDLVVNVRDLPSTSSYQVSGVLGMDVLRGFVVTVDPTRSAMQIASGSPEGSIGAGEPDDSWVELRWSARRPVVRVESAAGAQQWLLVATGATWTQVRGEGLYLQVDRVVSVRSTQSGPEILSERKVTRYRAEPVVVGTAAVRWAPYEWDHRGIPLLGVDVLGQVIQEYDFPKRRARFSTVPGEPEPGVVQGQVALGGR